MPVRFVPERGLERTAAVASETRAELDRQQSMIAARAQGNLSAVHDRGWHSISTSSGRVDRLINLDGPAALAVETGHVTRSGRVVRGANVLRNAIG